MKTVQFRQAICEAMSEEMRRDETIYLMGEEVAEYNGAYKASKGMLDEFGELRVIDTPISEAGFSGVGVGSTMVGARPIIEFMTFNFALVGIDQIINNAAKIRQMSGGQFPCPIVFRGPTASAGQLGATHSQAFESWFANCPGLKVIVPSNPYDAKGLLKSAIRDDDPVIFMEYAIDVAQACKELDVKSVAVTAGYICPEARQDFFQNIDAANVDLKAFTEQFYKKVCGGSLAAVLETLLFLKHETSVWFELTTTIWRISCVR